MAPCRGTCRAPHAAHAGTVNRPGCSLVHFPILRCVSRPRCDVDPSLQPITADMRLMPKGKLLVRAADFFSHSH